MTHCVDFWKKWKKQPNFCGLGKSAATSYDKYIKFVEDFSEEYKIPAELVYQNVPHTAVKPLLKFKDSSDIKQKVTKQIAQVLKDKHAITGKFINFQIGIDQPTKPVIESPINGYESGISKEILEKTRIKDRVRLLINAISPPEHKILIDIMEHEGLDNEYEALNRALIWARERI